MATSIFPAHGSVRIYEQSSTPRICWSKEVRLKLFAWDTIYCIDSVCTMQTKGMCDVRELEPDREEKGASLVRMYERIHVFVIVSQRLTSTYRKEPGITALRKPTQSWTLTLSGRTTGSTFE